MQAQQPEMTKSTNGVVLLSHGFQPEYECGFSNGIARNGLHVTMIGSNTTLVERLDSHIEFLNFRGSQDHRRPKWRKALNLLSYWLKYFAFLARNRNLTIHLTGLFTVPSLWVSLCEAWLTRLVAGTFVLTVHNLMPHDKHSQLNAMLSRWIYRAAKYCVVHTHRMRDELMTDYGIALDRIVVMEHGIDRIIPCDEPQRVKFRRKYGIEPQHKLVLFFGQIAPYKGLDTLLHAHDILAKESGIRFLIAGRCRNPKYNGWLHDEVRNRTAVGRITWVDDYIPDEDVTGLFMAADVLVMPYKHIDQSGVIFMAISTGLPIVATDVGSLKDYAPPGSLIVPPESPQELANALCKIKGRENQARSDVHDNATQFLWKNTVKVVLPLYGIEAPR